MNNNIGTQNYSLTLDVPEKVLFQFQDALGFVQERWLTKEEMAHVNLLIETMTRELEHAEEKIRATFQPAIDELMARLA